MPCKTLNLILTVTFNVTLRYVKYIGSLFLSMLKCIIIPLVIPSLIAAIGSMDLSLSSKVGVRAIVYYLATTVLAVILGIVLVTAIRPGGGYEHLKDEADTNTARNITTADTLMDLVRWAVRGGE